MRVGYVVGASCAVSEGGVVREGVGSSIPWLHADNGHFSSA